MLVYWPVRPIPSLTLESSDFHLLRVSSVPQSHCVVDFSYFVFVSPFEEFHSTHKAVFSSRNSTIDFPECTTGGFGDFVDLFLSPVMVYTEALDRDSFNVF